MSDEPHGLSSWVWLWSPLLVVASSSLFVGAWIGMSLVLSRVGGWRELARRYRATRPITGGRFRMQAAGMRWGVSYHGSVYLNANAHGVFLSAISLLRAGHPTLFIPWSDISFSRERRWLLDGVRLRFEPTPGISLHITAEQAAKIFAYGPLRLDT